MTTLPWIFEECENEGPICDPVGQPWKHAVRGRKPARPAVVGYGHTPSTADEDARRKATQQDAHEILGQRGEVVTMEHEEIDIRLGITFLGPDDVRPSLLRELSSSYGWHIEMEDWPSVIVRLSV